MPTDYAIAVERLLGVGRCFGTATTYQQLVNTWCDALSVPSQQALDAAWASYQAEQTALQIFKDYAAPYVNNIRMWVKIEKALDDNRANLVLSPTPTAATILANMKAQVNAAIAVLASDASQAVKDEFIRERILQGSTTPEPLNAAAVNGMTIGELRIIQNVLKIAANKGLAIAAIANSIK